MASFVEEQNIIVNMKMNTAAITARIDSFYNDRINGE